LVVEGQFAASNKMTISHNSKFPTHHAADLKTLLRFCGVLLLLAGITVARPMVAEKGKPLSSKDVSDLLDGSVPSSEIARVVTENGISFHMDDDLENQFRRAGATGELIDALKKADKLEAPPAAPPTGILKIRSQPGEAQVYIDDEPRGATSPAGDLRLPGFAPGSYQVRVSLGGYKTWENTITVTASESVTAFVTLEKQNIEPTVTLDADRNSIQTGQSVYLRWNSTNATNVDIEPGVGKVALAGATSVTPRESTTYTLTAIGIGGIKTATAYVAVTAPPPPLAPVVQPAVGNMPGFPVPGANFQALKFFESAFNPPAVGSRVYSTQFDHRTARYVSWELNLSCPPPSSRIDFTINATYYHPDGTMFNSQDVASFVNAGWPGLVFNSGRGWQRPGLWKRGTYRVDLAVNGNRIASGYFTIY
jgi:hypothetical protein